MTPACARPRTSTTARRTSPTSTARRPGTRSRCGASNAMSACARKSASLSATWRRARSGANRPRSRASGSRAYWVHTGDPILDAMNVQAALGQLDLLPLRVADLRRPQAMAVGHQDHGRVAMPIAAMLSGAVHQPLDLALGEIAPLDCQVYDAWGAFLGCRFHAGKPCLRVSYCIGYTLFLHSRKGRSGCMERIAIAMQDGGTGAGAQHGDAGREANLILSCRRTSIWDPRGGLFGFKFCGRERAPLGGGRSKIENSSRLYPRKFGQKRFLAVRRSRRKNGVACFWATSWEKIFGGVIAIISFRPGGWMQQSAVPRCAILSVRSTGGTGSETARVHHAARRRGRRLAARGARAAGRAHAPRRILASIHRERSRSAGSGRCISPRSRGARLDREPQYPNRASILWWGFGSNPSLCDRAGAFGTGPHRRQRHADYCRTTTGDRHHPDRFQRRQRSGWTGLRGDPVASRQQYHRLHLH